MSVKRIILFLCYIFCIQLKAEEYSRKRNRWLDSSFPLNIAHRGSSGTHPEHSTIGYRTAIDFGADFIECDASLTKDGDFVCMHDPGLSATTDVASREEFAARLTTRSLLVDGEFKTLTDWFVVDFTLEELRSLRIKQRYDFRYPGFDGVHQIPTIQEFIDVAKNYKNRTVGIYPELKFPSFANSLPIMKGMRVEDLFTGVLAQNGYTDEGDACLIQCFEENSLIYMSTKTNLPLVLLIEAGEKWQSLLKRWGKTFYGIGVRKNQVARYQDQGGHKTWIQGASDLVEKAHAAGLKVHVFTFRNEDRYIPWNFAQEPCEEYRFFVRQNVDGFFTEFPQTLSRCLASLEAHSDKERHNAFIDEL